VSLFVTGTDTGVGKTFTVTQLLRLLRASGKSCAGFKPICCGDRRDAELLVAASSDGVSIDDVNPCWLKTPAAPMTAAQIEQVKIDVGALLEAFTALRKRVEHVLVEGVGGWMVPISAAYFVSDLAAEINLPVLVVAQNRLGCLNHTSLTVRSIENERLPCAGVVLNSFPGAADIAVATNEAILGRVLDVPILPQLGPDLTELARPWGELFDRLERPDFVTG